jgi:hypothetical protein
MYEHHTAPLVPWPVFFRRLLKHGGYATLLMAVSLAGGTWGFHALALQAPIDALLNSAMLLGGMGPIGEIYSNGGKLFAAGFALYAGLVFLVASTLLLAPVLHRVLHSLHLEAERQAGASDDT